jgi:hypothetical protein
MVGSSAIPLLFILKLVVCPDFNSIVRSSRSCFNLEFWSVKLYSARKKIVMRGLTFAYVAFLARAQLELQECQTT